MILSIVFYKF
uniref:Uncharacterized protein n=1 Tax=Lepeophtheirus salmonis TaxID=72036 RepID=A0A0K2UML8_LEPSM